MALVYDISRIRLPEEPKRMDCLLFAFCVKGQAEYTVDTIHHTISAGQIIIIGIKQVVSGVHFSDDCIGRGVFISENYTREILSGMRDLSSIFLFSRMHLVFNMNKEGIQSMLSFFCSSVRKSPRLTIASAATPSVPSCRRLSTMPAT